MTDTTRAHHRSSAVDREPDCDHGSAAPRSATPEHRTPDSANVGERHRRGAAVRAARRGPLRQDARRDLLEEPQTLSASEWLEAFSGRFQLILDAAAARRVRAYAVKVGVGTAASRFPLLDQAIVLYACMAMLRELLALYGLRPNAVQTALLLARSVMATYLSGVLQDVSDDAADAAATAADNLSENGALQDVIAEAGRGAGEAVEAVGGGLLASLAGRAAEGALNGVLVWRLGARAIVQIQPVRPAK